MIYFDFCKRLFIFRENAITEMMHRHASEIRNSRSLGATSMVIFELKPFGISIRGLIGSEPWVGRSTGKMSGNSSMHLQYLFKKQGYIVSLAKVDETNTSLVKSIETKRNRAIKSELRAI